MTKIDLKLYNSLVEKRDEVTNRINKAKGSIETMREQLKKDHGCDTIKQAKKRLQELQESMSSEEKELVGKIESFQEKWENWTCDGKKELGQRTERQ